MSTYIVAFASGPFEYIESTVTLPISNTTIPLRVYGLQHGFPSVPLLNVFIATTSHIHLAQFALDVKAKVLPLYERLFDIPYPLPKLDTLVVSALSRLTPSKLFTDKLAGPRSHW